MKRIPLVLFFLTLGTPGVAADKKYFEEGRIDRLEQRVDRLENNRRTSPSRRPGARGASTATGISRAFNPAISANALLLGTFVDQGRDDPSRDVKTGMQIQELEIRLTGTVDTYFKADLTLSMEETDAIEIEELIAQALLFQSLSLRAGKFFTAFGIHNLLHTHQFPFIDAPLINEEIFGEEGLNEIGVSLDLLLPTPWFAELNAQVLEGDNALFSGPLNDDFLYLVHLRNLVELTPDWTAELGGSFAYGRNDNITGPYNDTQVAGADLRFKWKPGGRERYRTFIWQTEFINASREVDQKGFYSFLQYQFARRWWAQTRFDFFTRPRGPQDGDKTRISALLAWVLSEFSAVRLQYSYLDAFREPNEHQVFLQLNFTFGSHPAHKY